MKKQSTGRRLSAKLRRELEAVKAMPDSAIDYSDIPRQDPNDPKWRNAVVGKFYRPIKQPIALRLDADVIAWLKSQGAGYQSRINDILRREMIAHTKQ
ncbi:MAG: BrnA antitoxin family protein [Acidobacteriaceae bacterium]|nr:BrnA antitoxin family protein [Acidobacteriaceae bacterium]